MDLSQLSPKFQALLTLWRNRRGARLLPDRADFVAEDFRPWFGHMGILRVESQEPLLLRVTLAGTELVRYDGRDFTGKLLDEVVPKVAREAAMEPYRLLLAERRPVLHSILNQNSLLYPRLDRLLLPCTHGGAEIGTVLMACYVPEGTVGAQSVYEAVSSWRDTRAQVVDLPPAG